MKAALRILALASLLTNAAVAALSGESAADTTEAGKATPTVEETTLTREGQRAPDFSVQTLNGDVFTLSKQRGRVVLVNWFATWCPPCKEEMPFLQTEVWEKFQSEGLVMVSIAREEDVAKVKPFVATRALTWPFAVDPEREAYAKYAEAFIPRNQVIDREGKIIFQSQGFDKQEFDEMVALIAAELLLDMPVPDLDP